MIRFFILTVLFLQLPICSVDSTQYDVRDRTCNKLVNYEKEIDWCFNYLDKEIELNKNNAYGRELLKNNENLKKAVLEANQLFFKLREKFTDIAFAKHGNYPATKGEIIEIDSSITNWFTSYMEEILFPTDWKEEFQKFNGNHS
ncbi:MAG: hypothetical protein ChlgKO_14030 [Chlamydiales bacterium]